MKSLLVLFAMFLGVVYAQEVPAEIPAELAGILSFLGPILGSFAIKYPVLADVLGIMVTARLIIKPLMSALITMSKDTSIEFLDNIAAFSDNKIYKLVAFILDWVLSIKLPSKGK
jgi:hypothetical protein